jgi:hypothetical protein
VIATTTSNPSLWPAVIGVIGIVVGALATWVLARRGEATDRRRQGYASAMDTLVAYTEYPFQIRRRTSDDAATLQRLADVGHDLQRALRCQEAWIAGESTAVAEVFDEVRVDLAATLAAACAEAWNTSPVTSPAEMNLNGWGPSHELVNAQLARFQAALTCRFGWRRALSVFGLLIGVPKR